MRTLLLLALLSLLAYSAPRTEAQCFTRVPGVVIDYEEAPSLLNKLANINEVYIASPSITIMPNGFYVACHDLFDSGTNCDTTRVFLSKDRGLTWTHQATIVGQFWSTIFQHKGVLYLFGPQRQGGNLIIRKSTDFGKTWTEPTDAAHGLIREGKYGGTPNAPVVYKGRIWIAQSGTKVASAPADSDLMNAKSWAVKGGIPASHGEKHFGDRWQGWSEAQVVASPRTGVVLMPKIRALPYTALLRVDAETCDVSFDGTTENAFPSLPGGEKKFGVRYDPVSKRFFVLSNPVLPLEANHPQLLGKPEMIRTTAGVLSSTDLVNWNVEKLFLYSPNLDDGKFGEGFQYFNFEIDGEDLAVASRTAIDVGDGENRPPRGHDTNLMTFHRIEGFRHLVPDHILVVDTKGDRVLRFEETQHKRAPLGNFALGKSFAGTPLQAPVGVAQANGGDVYIREQAGRILRFDAAGNFLAIVSSDADVPTGVPDALNQTEQLHVQQPPKGECTWVMPESGDWSVATNWYYWGRPDMAGETAVFGSAADRDCTIRVDETFALSGMRFVSDHRYCLEGPGKLRVGTADGRARLDVQRGHHEIRAAVELLGDLDLNVEKGVSLTLAGPFALKDATLHVSGTGTVIVSGDFSQDKGQVVLDEGVNFTIRNSGKPKAEVTLTNDSPVE